ncbi:MAG: T9SS type A sorting domain-containing protein [Bacteroidales bacterium]|nr:T9SS type A sorting domain-containing protein [Bacteroidales bacterium]
MKKLTLIASALAGALCVSAQQAIQITVDIKSDVHAISPYIYGANDATNVATAIRWGGNRTSAYNWETNASNAGKDWGPHKSDNFFGTEAQGPAAPILNMVQTAKSRGQYALVTLQALGYVAADFNGNVSSTEKAPSNRWNEVKFRKVDENGNQLPLSLTPDKTDGVVYTDEEINFLINKLGTVGRGGIDAFAIDNEPALWSTTHPYAHSTALKPEELFAKTEGVASVVKEFAPHAEIFGPMYYGFRDAYLTPSYGVDTYLQNAKALEEKYGKRLVDVLAIHWYPEDRANGNRIVNIEGGSYNLSTPEMIKARLHAPREMWDPTATQNASAYPRAGDMRPVLVRLKNSVNTYYPGTKIAFTEFKFDAENHFSGGLALVDVLGVFGREGVYMACKWDEIRDNYATAAYNLYRNYDGNGSTFGETSVRALTTHNDTISTVASLDEQGNLHIMVVNKQDAPQTITYNLPHGLFVSGRSFGFDATSSTITEREAITAIKNNAFPYTVSAYSATHIVLQAAEQTKLVHAVIPADNAQTVVLTFDSGITETTETLLPNFTILREDGTPVEFSSVLQTAANQLTISVDYTFLAEDTLCTIGYEGFNFLGKSDSPIHDFDNVFIKNLLVGAPAFLYDASVNYNGKIITVNASKTVTPQELEFIKNNEIFEPLSIQQNPNNEYQYFVSVNPRITRFDTVQVNYGSNSALIIKQGPYDSPIFDSIVIRDNFTIYAYPSAELVAVDFNTAGFRVQEYEKELEISSVTYLSNKLAITLTDTLWSSKNYTLHYTDTDIIQSRKGGYMNDIMGQEIVNNLKIEPSPVIIGTQKVKIEIEDYSFIRSTTAKLEKCNDKDDAGFQFGFVGRGNMFAYMVDVAQAGKYTLLLRHSNTGGYMQISTGENDYELYVPSGSWSNSALTIDLQTGKQWIVFTTITATPNLNYFEISKGDAPSSAIVTKTQIQRADKSKVILSYNRLIETLPLPSEFTATINGTPIEILSIDYVLPSDKTQLLLQFPVAISGNFQLSHTETSGRTSNGGILEPYYYENTTTAIDETHETTITIYPNPSLVGQQITITGDAATTYTYTIYSITGARVAQQQFIGSATITKLPTGLYTITLTAENYSKITKLLVQ